MYRSAVIILFALVALGSGYNQLDNFLKTRSFFVRYDEDANCTAQFSCANCHTAMICKPLKDGGFEVVNTLQCPPDSAPYCNSKTGTCSKQPDPSCAESDPSFACMHNGYFPDVNCTAYHVCENYEASKYQCAVDGENYDAEQQICRKGAPCGTYRCKASGVKVPHTSYPQFFGYCSTQNGTPEVVDRCPGAYVLNVTSQLCEPECQNEGLQPDLNDCTKYFKCHHVYVPDSNHPNSWVAVMIKEHSNCAADMAFDPDQYMCVDIKQTRCTPL